MVRTYFVSVAFLVTVGGCKGQPASPRPSDEPLPFAAPPQAAAGARWVFAEPIAPIDVVDLPNGGRLLLGNNGRRAVSRGPSPPADATTLVAGDPVALLSTEDRQTGLVLRDASVLLARDPLGPAVRHHDGPPHDKKYGGTYFRAITAGHAVVLALTHGGRLYRSATLGATWTPIDVPGAPAHGRADSVALDDTGNGLLLYMPQRLFVTHDAGARWTPLPSLGIGAKNVHRDGKGRLFLEGRSPTGTLTFAVLDGAAMHATTEPEAPIEVAGLPRRDAEPAVNTQVMRGTYDGVVVMGDRYVELTAPLESSHAVEGIRVRSGKIGEMPAFAPGAADLSGDHGQVGELAGYAGELVYVREANDDDAVPASTVLRSQDYGTTWRAEATLPGEGHHSWTETHVAVGPKGWTYVGPLCDHFVMGNRTKCGRPRVRVAGAAAFEEMVSDEEMAVREVAFDEPRGKVYAIGAHDDEQRVYESSIDKNHFTRTKLRVGADNANSRLTVDGEGTVRVLAADEDREHWTVQRQKANGEVLPVLHLPLGDGTMALAGARGVLVETFGGAWETADGGESWSRVGMNGGMEQDLACGEGGCIDGHAHRVGWDLPVLASAPRVVAVSDPPKAPSNENAAEPPELDPIELRCKAVGATTPVARMPDLFVAAGPTGARWITYDETPAGKVSVVFGTRDDVRTDALLEALPEKARPLADSGASGSSLAVYASGLGMMAERHRDPPLAGALAGAPAGATDVELAWWSAASGKVFRQTLAGVQLPTRSDDVPVSLADDGVFFQAVKDGAVQFVGNDGRVQVAVLPPGSSLTNSALRIGGRWLLSDIGASTVLMSSSEDGKTWVQRTWKLDDEGWSSLTVVGRAPMLHFTGSGNPAALFPVPAVLPDDPPDSIAIDASRIDDPCEPEEGSSARFLNRLEPHDRDLEAQMDRGASPDARGAAVSLSARQRVTQLTKKGAECTAGYAFESRGAGAPDTTALIYRDGPGWAGWWFSNRKDHAASVSAQRVACVTPPAPAHR